MRSLFLCLALSFTSFLHAQTGQLQWGKTFQEPNSFHKVLTDAQDNVIMLFGGGSAPVTMGTTTHGAGQAIIVKYDAQGTLVWSRSVNTITLLSINLAEDSLGILAVGFVNNINGINMGNGVTTGAGVYAAGLLWKLDGNTGNSLWARNFNIQQNNNFLSGSNTRITQVDASPAGIFTISTYVNQNIIRKHDLLGNEVWSRSITTNGNAYTLSTHNHWVDASGVSFYAGYGDNANVSSVTLNNVSYTTNTNVNQFMFALDSSGNTLWARRNVNLATTRGLTVQPNGDVYINGYLPYFNQSNTNPFNPNYCNTQNTFQKGNIRTGKFFWERQGSSYGISVDGSGASYQYLLMGSNDLQFATSAGVFRPTSSKSLIFQQYNADGDLTMASSLAHYTGNITSLSVKSFTVNKQGKALIVMTKPSGTADLIFGSGTLSGSAGAQMLLLQINPQAAQSVHQTTWTGMVSGAWFTSGNWTNGIPLDSSTVTIAAGAPNYPNQDNQFYNFGTNAWAKCGTLIIQPGVTFLYGYGARINGLLINQGTIIYNYQQGFALENFDGWGAVQWSGTGTMRYTGGTGSRFSYARCGRMKVELALNTSSSSLSFDCVPLDSLLITLGNISNYPQAQGPLHIVGGIRWTGNTGSFIGTPFRHRLNTGQPLLLNTGAGTSAQPLRLMLAQPSRIQYLTASFNPSVTGAAPNTTINNISVSSSLNGGMWTLTPDTTLEPGNSYSLTTYLRGSTNTSNVANYGLLKRTSSSSAWAQAGNHVAARDSSGYIITAATGITGFSDYAVGVAAASLPFTELKLAGQVLSRTHILRWSLLASGVTQMELQRSADGNRFETMVTLPFSQSGSHQSVASENADYYYRLRLTDQLQAVAYTNVVKLGEARKMQPTIYPTRFSTQLQLILPGNELVQIQLYNAEGQLMYTRTGLRYTAQIPVPELARGSYRCLLRSQTNGEILLSQWLMKE